MKIKKIILILLGIILLWFSPTIISSTIGLIKSTNKTISIGVVNWLMFYGAVFGGLCTLLAFLLSELSNKNHIKEQQKENIKLILHQEENSNLDKIIDSLTSLIETFNSVTPKIRNSLSLLLDDKFDEAFLLIEETRSKLDLNMSKFYLISDIKENKSDCAKTNCNVFDLCKKYETAKRELDNFIENLGIQSFSKLNHVQEYINIMRENHKNIIDKNINEKIINDCKNLNKLLENQGGNEIEIQENKNKINESTDNIKLIQDKILSQEELEKLSEDVTAILNSDNNQFSQLLNLSKCYLELKKTLIAEKLK